MARTIPSDFDVFKEHLDQNELVIRDSLKVKINNWAKFRYSIYAGNNSDVLICSSTIDIEVKQAFIELAKSHYEVVNSIGYAKLCLTEIQLLKKSQIDYFFRTMKGLKEFYIHLGSVFDNLARLIYILNSPDSSSKKNGTKLVRHWIDWPRLTNEFNFANYQSLMSDTTLAEILIVRNNFIHNWRSVIQIDQNGDLYLSKQIRSDRNYLWNYEEKTDFNTKYVDWMPLMRFMSEDYIFVENCQDKIFEQLILDLSVFETNYNLKIKE
jgi:hypothetical protein